MLKTITLKSIRQIMLLVLIVVSSITSNSQEIVKLKYSFVSGGSVIYSNRFELDFDTRILEVRSCDKARPVISHKLSKRKMKKIKELLKEDNLAEIPETPYSKFIDGTTYRIEIIYDDGSVIKKEDGTKPRSDQFKEIIKFFDRYKRTKLRDGYML